MRIVQDEENNKKNKKENVGRNDANLLAIILAVLGIMTLVLGDGGTYKSFPVPAFVGWIELGVAAVFAILGFRAEQNPYEEQIMICPECQTVYLPHEISRGQCQKCHCSLEPLEGFYERHPELKDTPEQFNQPDND